MLKPGAALSFAIGSLSGAAASGGGATGASLAAASLLGRPISGEPCGSGCAAAGGLACCAEAEKLKTLIKTPASKMLRGDEQAVMSSSLIGGHCRCGGRRCRPKRPYQCVIFDISQPARNRKHGAVRGDRINAS